MTCKEHNHRVQRLWEAWESGAIGLSLLNASLGMLGEPMVEPERVYWRDPQRKKP